MRLFAQFLCFVINLALASAVFAFVFAATLWIFDGASRDAFADFTIIPAFWMAFALGWMPSLLAYSRIDYPGYRRTTKSALILYAKWGGVSAATVPAFIMGLMLIFEGDQSDLRLEDLRTTALLLVWFFIPGAVAGAVFGALVPLGLPSSRDGRRADGILQDRADAERRRQERIQR